MDLDDEDPDMEGWDDMYDGDAVQKDEEVADSADMDAFMDKMDDVSDEEDSADEEPQFGSSGGEDIGDDAFMDASDDDSDSDSEEPSLDGGPGIQDNDDEASEDDLVLMDDLESDEAGPVSRSNKKKRSKKESAELDTFADASEYAELINKGWQEMKEQRSVELDSEELDPKAAPPLNPLSGGKKRKRRPKKKCSSQEY